MNSRILMALITAAAVCFGASDAMADAVISFNPGVTQTIYQGEIGTVVISATNSGDQAIDLAQLSLAIQLIGAGTNTGSVSITGISPTGFWYDPSTSSSDGTLQNGNVNGTSDYTLLSISDNGLPDPDTLIPVFSFLQPGQSVNLAEINFTTSGDSFGTWEFFVVNEEDENGFSLSNILTSGFTNVQFANATAPSYSSVPNTGVSFRAGTVVIVPEPASLAICGSGLLAAVAFFRRRSTR